MVDTKVNTQNQHSVVEFLIRDCKLTVTNVIMKNVYCIVMCISSSVVIELTETESLEKKC